jgi:hypothetical protein
MSDPGPLPGATTPPLSPPPPDGIPAETLPRVVSHPDEPTVRPDGVSVPGYEVLSSLGRGGMGVVYKARHTGLGRVVALKMVLSGAHASEVDRARFRTEAEAIARLQHPNVVQVFEVGEHAGVPYLALEFCPGGSLEQKLSGTPLPPGEAAALVEALARAMQAAHDKGVIHRDLKPANVLLASPGRESGELVPKITDFGLAKKLGEAGQTASGAVLGTPSYMAPEQAEYKPDAPARDIGPACDVYALGAILYECLTGRPPFRAATALDTILQVISDEPVPPARLQSGTPRDLETICLKCLQKAPTNRYASAAALADDLRRFRQGEVIAARPVGRLERAWKWAKRRPAAAALLAVSGLAGLALVGTVGTAAAVVYGKNQDLTAALGRATEAEQLARDEAEKARAAEGKARDEAEKARTAEGHARDQAEKAEVALFDGLLRPVGNHWNEQLDPAEKQALGDVARLDERLRLRFLERGLSQPESAERLGRRTGFVIDAVAGKDAAMRERVRAAALAALRRDGADWRARVAGTLLANALGERSPQFAREGVVALLEGAARTTGRSGVVTGEQTYFAVAEYLSRQLDAAGAGAAAGAALADLDLCSVTAAGIGARSQLAWMVTTLAPRMDTASARDTVAQVVQAIAKKPNVGARSEMARAVAALAARIPPAEAAPVCLDAATPLVRAIAQEPHTQFNLAEVVAALAGHMDSAEAARVCADAAVPLARDIPMWANFNLRSQMARTVPALAPRLSAPDAAEVAALLVQDFAKETHPNVRFDLAGAIVALAPRMSPAKAAPLCAQVATPLALANAKERNTYPLARLAHTVAALAGHMDAADAAKVCAEAAAPLGPAILSERNPNTRQQLVNALTDLALRMNTGQAAKVCAETVASLAQAIAKEPNPIVRSELAQAVAALAIRMKASEGARLCAEVAAPLARDIRDGANAYARPHLAGAVAVLAARMDPAEAARLCAEAAAPLVQAIPKEPSPIGRHSLAQGVAALAARMDAVEAARVCAQAATPLAQTIAQEPDSDLRYERAQLLATLAARMDPAEAAKLCAEIATPLARAVHAGANPYTRSLRAGAVAALAARMDAAEAARVCAQAADPLAEAIPAEYPPGGVTHSWTRAVAALAEWMDPRDVADLLTKHDLPPEVAPAVLDRLAPLACRRFETVADAARWFRESNSEFGNR